MKVERTPFSTGEYLLVRYTHCVLCGFTLVYLYSSQVAVGQGRGDKFYKVQWVVARLAATAAALAHVLSASTFVSWGYSRGKYDCESDIYVFMRMFAA